MKEQVSNAERGMQNAESNPKSTIQTGSGLPASTKVYVETNGLRVPFREISLSPSKAMDGSIEENAPVRVYDTSGPWTDPELSLDVREGLPPHRLDWIISRGDVEQSKSDEGKSDAFRRFSAAPDDRESFTRERVTLTSSAAPEDRES